MASRLPGPAVPGRPILGLGGQRLVDSAGCSEAAAVALLHEALGRGVSYFDTAPVYGLGQSEQRLGLVARDRRDEMWIATKTAERTRDGALAEAAMRAHIEAAQRVRVRALRSEPGQTPSYDGDLL